MWHFIKIISNILIKLWYNIKNPQVRRCQHRPHLHQRGRLRRRCLPHRWLTRRRSRLRCCLKYHRQIRSPCALVVAEFSLKRRSGAAPRRAKAELGCSPQILRRCISLAKGRNPNQRPPSGALGCQRQVRWKLQFRPRWCWCNRTWQNDIKQSSCFMKILWRRHLIVWSFLRTFPHCCLSVSSGGASWECGRVANPAFVCAVHVQGHSIPQIRSIRSPLRQWVGSSKHHWKCLKKHRKKLWKG